MLQFLEFQTATTYYFSLFTKDSQLDAKGNEQFALTFNIVVCSDFKNDLGYVLVDSEAETGGLEI